MGRPRSKPKNQVYAGGKRLKWIYQIFFRERGDPEAEYRTGFIADCQSIEEVRVAFDGDPQYEGMMLAHCRRVRRMTLEDVKTEPKKKKPRKMLEAPAKGV